MDTTRFNSLYLIKKFGDIKPSMKMNTYRSFNKPKKKKKMEHHGGDYQRTSEKQAAEASKSKH